MDSVKPVSVLITCWSRPDLVQKLFAAIPSQFVDKLYISLDGQPDGPRKLQDAVEKTRRMVRNLEAQYPIQIRESTHHLGLRRSMLAGVDWFFENETEGIILEDDVFPTQDFFWFASAGLAEFRDNERVSLIAGTSHVPPIWPVYQSHFFSRFQSIWGFATWRRAWRDFSAHVNQELMSEDELRELFPGMVPSFYRHWEHRLKSELAGDSDTWSASWNLFCARRGMLAVIPTTPVVENVGLGSRATNHGSIPLVAGPPPIPGPLPRPLHGPSSPKPYLDVDRYIAYTLWPTQQFFFRFLLGLSEFLRRRWFRALDKPGRGAGEFYAPGKPYFTVAQAYFSQKFL